MTTVTAAYTKKLTVPPLDTYLTDPTLKPTPRKSEQES